MGLSNERVGAAVAVSDMERARAFYEGKLGLSGGREEGDGGVTYACGGGTTLHIFPSAGAGKSESTLAAWDVSDLDSVVEELSGNGVTLEQYDEPTKTDERGIASFGEARGGWIKDPDGNVLAIFEEPA